MSLRMPASLSAKTPMERGVSFLDAELQVEKGASLGRAGRAVTEAIETLSAIEAGTIPGDRRAQVDEAAALVWELIVQQEACGIRNPQMTYREYKIPRDVIARVGAVRPKAGKDSAGVSFVKMMRPG
jgi:hypothetical protein